jgi:hypothetical protein
MVKVGSVGGQAARRVGRSVGAGSAARDHGFSARFAAFSLLVPLVVGGTIGLGCTDKPKELPAAPVVLAAVPEPAGLALDVFIPKPGTLWTKVRNLGGDKLKLLPDSFPMVVASLLGLPPGAIESIEPDAPAFGALVLADGKEYPVLALHLRNGSRFISQLTLGTPPKFVKKTDEPSGVTLLEPAGTESSLNAAMGVAGDYLLLGYAPDGLLKLGAYVTRTLPTKKLSSEDVVIDARGEALAGPVATLLGAKWGAIRDDLLARDKAQRDQKGTAPTYGDPAAVVGRMDASAQGGLAIMKNLSSARATLALDAAGAHLRVAAVPAEGDGLARQQISSLRLASPAPILTLPSSVVAAISRADDPAEREAATKEQVESLDRVLGGKLSAAEKTKVAELATAWGKGRGESFVGGLMVSTETTGFAALFPVADQKEADLAIRGAFSVLKIPAISEPFKHWLGELKVGALPPPGSTGVVKIVRKPPPSVSKAGPKAAVVQKPSPPENLEAAWTLPEAGGQGSFVFAGQGREVEATIGKDGKTLAADGDVKAAIDRLGNDVSTAVLVMPSRFLAATLMRGMVDPAKVPSAPVILSIGRSGGDGVFRVDAHPAAVREMVKIRQMN